MNTIRLLLKTSLGLKIVMAVSGAGLLCFLVGHLLGSLRVFLPPDALNRYGHFLRSTPEVLWTVRLGGSVLIGLHVWSAVRLWAENRRARPVGYLLDPAVSASSFASRHMLLTGLVVAAFFLYHLLHFTVRVESLNGAPVGFHSLKHPVTGQNDVYAMVIAGFRVWYVSLFYILALGLLCLHLSHGVNAMFQSLGLMNRAYRGCLVWLARVVAVVVFCGYASIPVAVLLGHGHGYLQRVVDHNRAAAVVSRW